MPPCQGGDRRFESAQGRHLSSLEDFMSGADDHETVSIYPFSEQQINELMTKAGECTFNWGTIDGWPVGVIMSFLWKNGSVWVTAGAHRHRISAIRRDPRVSIVVSGAAAQHLPGSPAGAITIKGRAVIHEDRSVKDWFYPEFSGKGNPDAAAAQAFADRLDSPLRVVIEVIPEKWITFDAAKFGADAMGVLSDDQKGPMLSADSERMPAELKRRGIS